MTEKYHINVIEVNFEVNVFQVIMCQQSGMPFNMISTGSFQ